MTEVFITQGLRTFIGLKDKAYRYVPAEDLACDVLSQLKAKLTLQDLQPELVIAGNCTGGGGNIARLAALKAGLGDSVAGISLDSQCSSGLESIITGFSRISAGLNSMVIAGGTESASTSCRRSYNPNHPNYNPSSDKNSYSSAQFIPEDFDENSMIRAADATCRKYGISGEDMIPFAIKSHIDAIKARNEGILSDVTLTVAGLDKDESIRPSMSQNFASRLAPVLEGGIITAATSCLFNDGAAFVALCNKELAKKSQGPLFKICHAVTCGGNRFLSPESMVSAIEKLIQKSGIPESRIDRIDYNQAFACLDVLYQKRFDKPSNCFGGALAYGHPYGASGAVVLIHLTKAMTVFNERFGIAAVPAAGGVASAILVERVR